MESVVGYGVNEGLPPENDEAVSFSNAPDVRRSQEGQALPLLAGYLVRIGRGRLLAREEKLDLGRLARSGNALKIELEAGKATPACKPEPQSARHHPCGSRPALQRHNEGPKRGDRVGCGYGLRGALVRARDQDHSLPATPGCGVEKGSGSPGPRWRMVHQRGATREHSRNQDAEPERLIRGDRHESGRGYGTRQGYPGWHVTKWTAHLRIPP
jgi:hypothetical protein